MSNESTSRRKKRRKRHWRIRNRISGSAARPRLAVYRSLRNIYCQVIDDEAGRTLCAASSLDLVRTGSLDAKAAGAIPGAEKLGEIIAERAKEAGIKAVAFDRGGFRYHGRVKALAEAARKGGLDF